MLLPSDPKISWPENALQEATATFLNHLESLGFLAWHHPPLGGLRHRKAGAKLKRQGAKAGTPDCEIFLKGGKTVFIELKTNSGRLHQAQKNRHKLLNVMGYEVHVVYASSPNECVDKVQAILRDEGVAV